MKKKMGPFEAKDFKEPSDKTLNDMANITNAILTVLTNQGFTIGLAVHEDTGALQLLLEKDGEIIDLALFVAQYTGQQEVLDEITSIRAGFAKDTPNTLLN